MTVTEAVKLSGLTPSAAYTLSLIHISRAANVLLKMLGEETVQEDPAADALAKAKELLGGVDSAID